jgi:ribonuclease HI
MHRNNIWIESDSSLVVRAFQNPSHEVTWNLWNRWRNALVLFKPLNGMVSHIFREGNQVADSLVNFGCTLSSPTRWHQAPQFI